MRLPRWLGGGDDDAQEQAFLIFARRRRQMANEAARVAVPVVATSATEKHVLQADFVNTVSSPTGGYVEVEIVRDADGRMRFYAAGGGGGTDHGALTGLGDDDHTQYVLANGSRAFSGVPSSTVAASSSQHLTRYQEVSDTFGVVFAALLGCQPLDAELTALAGLASAADKLPYFTGSGTASLATLTSAARGLLDDENASTMRTTLGLAIGTNVQAHSDSLQGIADLEPEEGDMFYFDGSIWKRLNNPGVAATLKHDGSAPYWDPM